MTLNGTNGVNSPAALAIDGAGDLFVANEIHAGVVYEYPPPYTASNAYFYYTPDSTDSGYPWALALDGSGHLWVSTLQLGLTFIYNLPFTGAPSIVGEVENGRNGGAIAVDGAGNVFVADTDTNTVYDWWNPFNSSQTLISNGLNFPQALALDGAGNLFVANQSTVTEYAPPYTGAPTATIRNGINGPVSLAIDGAGDLFVANYGAGSNNTVTEYAPPYTGTATTISNALNQPFRLVLTP
jgi:serine/threonine-protein kinase